MNNIEVCFSPALFPDFRNQEAIAVIVDILRFGRELEYLGWANYFFIWQIIWDASGLGVNEIINGDKRNRVRWFDTWHNELGLSVWVDTYNEAGTDIMRYAKANDHLPGRSELVGAQAVKVYPAGYPFTSIVYSPV